MEAGKDAADVFRIERAIWTEMIGYCLGKLPFEACGALYGPELLLGSPESSSSAASSIGPAIRLCTPIANSAVDPMNSFAFDAADWTASLYAAERKRFELVGVFHSHPQTNSLPSVEDLAQASSIGGVGYWIVSFLSPSCPEVRAYRLIADHNGYERFQAASYTIV